MPPCPALLVDTATVAKLLGVSNKHVINLRQDGRFGLAGIKLGRRLLFSCSELQEWIAAGAPNRERWDQTKLSGLPR
jgi:excisionase family DNA binding protein